MFDEKSIQISRTMFLFDVLLTPCALLVAFALRNIFVFDQEIDFASHIFLIPLLLTFIIAFLSYFGGYRSPRSMKLISYAWSIFRSLALSIGLLMTLLFMFKIEYVSRIVIGNFTVMEFFTLLIIRIGLKSYFLAKVRKKENYLRVLIIGTGERARELSEKLRSLTEWGIKIIGHLDPDPARVGGYVLDAPVIGTIDDISACLKNHVVDEVVIGIPRSLLENAEPIAHACEEEGIKLRFMADVFSLHAARISFVQMEGIPLLTLEPVAQDEFELVVKRCFDLVLALLAMPIVLPIMAVVAIAIKLNSPGPVFFVQQRVGLKKRLFPMIKFRSMYADAEEKLSEIEHLNEAEGPIFKITDDPRITRVGNFIRRTSLDELPQLFNVIRGEMSLVGPRPMSIRDVDLFDKGIQRKRFSVKPGLTCIWQISGRSDLPFTKWLELDLEYIENWNLWLDVKILFKTIPAVVFSKGAV